MANGDKKPGKYQEGNTLVNCVGTIGTTQKKAFARALFDQHRQKGEKDLELTPVDFTGGWFGEVYPTLSIELAEFIDQNYELILTSFLDSNQSDPDIGAQRLVEETTTDSNTFKYVHQNDSKPQRGPGKRIEVMPPVAEAIVSQAYTRCLSVAKQMMVTHVAPGKSFEQWEFLSRNANMIAGSLKGYQGKLDSIQKKNEAIFDAVWSSVPFTNTIKDALLKTIVDRSLEQVKNKIKSNLRNNPLMDPNTIATEFEETMRDIRDSIPEHDLTKMNEWAALNFESIIDKFKLYVK